MLNPKKSGSLRRESPLRSSSSDILSIHAGEDDEKTEQNILGVHEDVACHS